MPANEAIFRKGDDVITISRTPGSDVPAGEVVLMGTVPLVAHTFVPAGRLGEFAAGGGVYDCKAQSGSDIAAGAIAYWDATNRVISTSATGNGYFGFAAAAVAKGTVGPFVHRPDARAFG